MREVFATDINQLANDIIRNIYNYNLDLGNTILVGHSMGAQVAYETCLLLEKNNTPPAGIVISACHAPHLKGRRILSHLDDDEFIKQLKEIGGLSHELLEEKRLLNFSFQCCAQILILLNLIIILYHQLHINLKLLHY